jgi:hypothetical protein
MAAKDIQLEHDCMSNQRKCKICNTSEYGILGGYDACYMCMIYEESAAYSISLETRAHEPSNHNNSLASIATGTVENTKAWTHGIPGSPIKGSRLFRGYCKVCGTAIRVVDADTALLNDCGCSRRSAPSSTRDPRQKSPHIWGKPKL